jgi:signal transduction histidine kinase
MPYRILVVDDDESASALILSALADDEYDPKAVRSSVEALSAVQSFAPHVIIVSRSRDEMRSLELIETLRSQTNIPLIIACDCNTCESAGKMLRDGDMDLLVLPSPRGQVRHVVRRALERTEHESHGAECIKALEERERRISDLEKSLQQAERMAALGSLLAGVVHDINTPLAGISGNNGVLALAFEKVQALLKQNSQSRATGLSEDIASLAKVIEDTIRTDRLACDYIERIVSGLRNFARGDPGERRKADIHERIEIALALAAHELKHRVQVTKEFGNIPQVECYPNQLDQVFINILVNASQAISGLGEIKIRTWEEGDTVRIAISDTGCGIPPEFHSRLFESGFTTKAAGTGLGLSICRKIITGHGGRIELKSQVGNGSTFTIVLPIRNAEEKDNNG